MVKLKKEYSKSGEMKNTNLRASHLNLSINHGLQKLFVGNYIISYFAYIVFITLYSVS